MDLIELGKLTIMKSLKDMQGEGDDLNLINYDMLIEKVMRNIEDKNLLQAIQEVDKDKVNDFVEEGHNFEWRDELK